MPTQLHSLREYLRFSESQVTIRRLSLTKVSIPDDAQLKLEAMKIFAPDFDEQWSDIHRGLYQLQMKGQNPSEAILGALEPTLSVAGAIVVWRWLSFPIPLALHWAAIVTFACFGVALLLVGVGHGISYMDGSSL
jgi:hypothetical protein